MNSKSGKVGFSVKVALSLYRLRWNQSLIENLYVDFVCKKYFRYYKDLY